MSQLLIDEQDASCYPFQLTVARWSGVRVEFQGMMAPVAIATSNSATSNRLIRVSVITINSPYL